MCTKYKGMQICTFRVLISCPMQFFQRNATILLKENPQNVPFPPQGSEIFTVVAKDGDVGNPNPIRYSFEEGEPASRRFAHFSPRSEKCLKGCVLAR